LKRPKYGNRITYVDGIKFHSAGEAKRYQDLKLLEREGVIRGLELQQKFVFRHNGVRIGSFTADFTYDDVKTGRYVVEDFKGRRTQQYQLRKRLMMAFYGIEILETGK
jgi:hypothetical protein